MFVTATVISTIQDDRVLKSGIVKGADVLIRRRYKCQTDTKIETPKIPVSSLIDEVFQCDRLPGAYVEFRLSK